MLASALLERIADIDAPGSEVELRSVLALAPDALTNAERLDEERANGTVRGPLHGVPLRRVSCGVGALESWCLGMLAGREIVWTARARPGFPRPGKLAIGRPGARGAGGGGFGRR